MYLRRSSLNTWPKKSIAVAVLGNICVGPTGCLNGSVHRGGAEVVVHGSSGSSGSSGGSST